MTSVDHLDPLAIRLQHESLMSVTNHVHPEFRQRVLYGEFNAIKINEVVWVQVMPEFVKMYDFGDLYMEGRVIEIIDYSESPDFHPSDDRKVVVKTRLGQWTFTRDGLSLNKICKLAVSRVHGQLLWLYEPEFVPGVPPTERAFQKEPIEPKCTRRELHDVGAELDGGPVRDDFVPSRGFPR